MTRALNPEILSAAARSTAAPFGSLPPSETRANYIEARKLQELEFLPVASIEDIAIKGDGAPLKLRLYRDTFSDDQQPCLLFLHGGGWMVGNLDTHEGLCRKLAKKTRMHVLAVDYRLAPEHPFPAGLEDAARALSWLVRFGPDRGIDISRLAICGDSAGGNFAAVLAIMASRGEVPKLTGQILLYPVTDLRMASESYRLCDSSLPLTPTAMRFFIDHYLPRGVDREDWRASPLLAASLARTPPAIVLTCGHDPLRDEGDAYARRLEQEGVAVTHLHLSDQVHGFLNFGRAVGAVEGVVDFLASWLNDLWRTDIK
ncbi:alpha/beta hydrolase [Acetobacter sacchari]|uniref:Alpha/beta hydrolase n=1 Tax=Acetobacter sacchari TaxID=2661687 RepID=A0ABS3LUL7_9PROT|nr:alpha/beta hydrolase [Acetobacter sacchari]MBO1359601.1 alpha/beta hydrolase [Acetobacter sacchari]